jgi:hypothetical protein
MISIVLFVLAGMFSAIKDSVENEHIWDTWFAHPRWRFKPVFSKFIYKRLSWNQAKVIFSYKVDLWHISKTCEWGCFVMAMVCYREVINPFVDIVVYSSAVTLSFNTFYNHIFKLKKP